MKAINKLKEKIEELRNYVNGNTGFSMEIHSSAYPMSIEFRKGPQIGLLDENVSENSPSLCFVFDDEMRIITTEDFKINEAVFNKLKNLSKEINRLYLHSFREEFDKAIEPIWNCCDEKAQVVFYRKRDFDKIMNQFEE
jgi:hypothetical protein